MGLLKTGQISKGSNSVSQGFIKSVSSFEIYPQTDEHVHDWLLSQYQSKYSSDPTDSTLRIIWGSSELTCEVQMAGTEQKFPLATTPSEPRHRSWLASYWCRCWGPSVQQCAQGPWNLWLSSHFRILTVIVSTFHSTHCVGLGHPHGTWGVKINCCYSLKHLIPVLHSYGKLKRNSLDFRIFFKMSHFYKNQDKIVGNRGKCHISTTTHLKKPIACSF